jgi:hypothetical protein
LIAPLENLDMPIEFIKTLRREAINLGSTKVPANTPTEMIKEVELLIKTSFIKSFNRVAFISAIAAWISAILCFAFLKGGKNN